MRKWIMVLLFPAVPAIAQQPKNVQILTGMSRPEVQRVMNEMRAGLGVHCHYCHTNGDAAEDTKPQKIRAREMMRMVVDINARNFGGKPVVTCFTCHNGQIHPARTPPLPQPIPPDVGAVAETRTFPAVATIVQKYVAAVGRELTPSTPRLFKGTTQSVRGPQVPTTFAEAGEKARVDVTLPDGNVLTRVSDPKSGWIRDKNGVRDLNAEELIAAAMSRRPYAPFYTSVLGDDARVVDTEKIGEHNAWVVATPTARYSFDADTGLLLRRVFYYDTVMGRIPEQTDFEDYRDVGGAKVPFLTRVSLVDPWLGGTRRAETIQVGVPIAPSEFEKPPSLGTAGCQPAGAPAASRRS